MSLGIEPDPSEMQATRARRASIWFDLLKLALLGGLILLVWRAFWMRSHPAASAALESLHDIGDRMPFVPPETVKAGLEDASPEVRYWAAAALGHAGRGIEPLIPALLHHAEHDVHPGVRNVCADEPENSIKAAAITPAVVPAVMKALDSRDIHVRYAACCCAASYSPEYRLPSSTPWPASVQSPTRPFPSCASWSKTRSRWSARQHRRLWRNCRPASDHQPAAHLPTPCLVGIARCRMVPSL